MRKESRIVSELLKSSEPSIRWRTRVGVLRESRDELRISRLEQEVRRSPRVRRLLRELEDTARHPYSKWTGSHWVLASLADLGYPRHDQKLEQAATRILEVWLSTPYSRTFEPKVQKERRRVLGIPVIEGRARAHASVQGNALRSLSHLELGGERCKDLAELLLRWQWPDGGWNCDRTPSADTSSFMETLLPMRGLAAYARCCGESAYRVAAQRAAEIFLERSMFRRRSDGRTIRYDFVRLHFPLYWHYDVLGGLVGLSEAGRLGDPRVTEALDLLEGRQLPRGGWPADARFYGMRRGTPGPLEAVDWGAPSRVRRNDWVTADALAVLHEAGRVSV